MKTQTLQTEYDHVYSGDPALDQAAERWREKYDRAIELSDMAQLPLQPSAKPVLWRLRHLTRGERSKVADLHDREGTVTSFNAAVQLALVGAEGAVGADGRPLEVNRTALVGRFQAAPESVLDRIAEAYGGESLIIELAGRVFGSFNPRKG